MFIASDSGFIALNDFYDVMRAACARDRVPFAGLLITVCARVGALARIIISIFL